jgi:hypothetical protein
MAEMLTPWGGHPITLRKITLWRREIDSRPEALTDVLEPFVNTGTDLQVVMRYRHPREDNKAIVEVYPQSSEEEEQWRPVMQAAGLKASYVPALLIEGDYVSGLSYGVAKTIAELNLKIMFLVAQTTDDGKYTATIGFESDADAEKAAVSLLHIKSEVLEREDELSAGETQ